MSLGCLFLFYVSLNKVTPLITDGFLFLESVEIRKWVR